MDYMVSYLKNLYQKWMNFAEKLNKFFTTIIFGLIYFLLLPIIKIFATKDPLGLKAPDKKKTFWIDRSQTADALEHLQRMG